MNTSRILTLRLRDQSRRLGYWFLFPSLCHQDELVISTNNPIRFASVWVGPRGEGGGIPLAPKKLKILNETKPT